MRVPRFAGLLLACLLVFAAAPARARDMMLALAGWSEAVDPAVLDAFTRETGIAVAFDSVDDADALIRKLIAGNSGYDAVFLTGGSLAQLASAGALKPLDALKLANLRTVLPAVKQAAAVFDPGNQFSAPYMWGVTAFGIDEAKVQEKLGPNPPRSWDLLLKPELAGKLKDCGISVVDGPDFVLPGVLRSLGLPPASLQPGDLQRAADALARVRGLIRKFHGAGETDGLATGDVCLMVGRSRDLVVAQRRAQAARSGSAISIIAPREGAPIWLDTLAIAKDAPNADAALTLLNFLLRPEIAAANAAYLGQASSATAMPDPATTDKMFAVLVRDLKTQVVLDRLWARVKASR